MSELSRGIGEVKDRLEKAAVVGGILDGWKIVTVPRSDTEPLSSLPAARLQGIALDELMVPRSSGSSVITLAIEVAVDRKGGVVALADGVAAVLDAIETDPETESPEQSILDSTQNGMKAKTEGSGITGIALWTIVTITLGTRPFHRGKRRGAS